MRYMVFGSTVTRDAFAFVDEAKAQVVRCFSRSSLASVYVGGKKDNVDLQRVSSKFQRLLIKADMENQLTEYVKSKDYDYLIYDPVDERFDLLISDKGEVCTASNELISSNVIDHSDMHRISSGSEAFFDLWEEAWIKLITQLSLLGKKESLIVNKVYWASVTDAGAGFDPVYSEQKIADFNAFLDKLYARMSEDICRENFLEYKQSLFVGAENHKWGRGPFHYMPSFYEAFVQKLEKLQSKHAVPLSQLWINQAKEDVAERSLLGWAAYGVTNGAFVDEAGNRTGKVATRGKLTFSYDHVSASFQGAAGSFEIKLTVNTLAEANGVSACYHLDGWDEIKYFAIGYSAPEGFRHIKITNVRQGAWDRLSFSEHDIIFGLQRKWQETPTGLEIGDIRLYVKGTPSKNGARIAARWVSVWSDTVRGFDPAVDDITNEQLGAEEKRTEVVTAILRYVAKCNPDLDFHAIEYLRRGRLPLTGCKYLDWSIDSPRPDEFDDVGTYRYLWHAMQPALTLMAYAKKHDNFAAISAARDYVADWLERSFLNPDPDIKYTWYDHGTAERLLAFLLMYQIGEQYEFDYRFMARLGNAIIKHGQLLESEAFYAAHQSSRYHNHAWFQDMALIAAGQLMVDLSCADRWLQKGIQRLTDQFDKLIVTDQGFSIFVENSIGYHLGVQRLAEFAGELVELSGKKSDIPKIAAELDGWSKFLRYPDGRTPSQGDTFRKPNPEDIRLVRRGKPYTTSSGIVLADAGYAVAKGNHDGLPFMVCMFGTSLCETHKHEDNLSFTLFFDGIEWLIDPSFYSHDYTAELPAYLRSAQAHNTHFVVNRKYTNKVSSCTLARREGIGSDHVFVGTSSAYEGIVLTREFRLRAECFLLQCTEVVEADPNELIYTSFHFGEGVTPMVLDGGMIELKHPLSEYKLLLTAPAAGVVAQGYDERHSSFTGHGFMQFVETYSAFFPIKNELKWSLHFEKKIY